jgi:plastocyanin
VRPASTRRCPPRLAARCASRKLITVPHQRASERNSPNPISVALGSTVTWTNLDGVAHTVTADDGSWGSSMLGQGATYSHVFTSPGTYTYHSAIHLYMMGTVVVTP